MSPPEGMTLDFRHSQLKRAEHEDFLIADYLIPRPNLEKL
jgi:hypothetical protein